MSECRFQVAGLLRISVHHYSLHVAIKSSLNFNWLLLTAVQVVLMKAMAGAFSLRRVHEFLEFNSFMFFVTLAFWWV